MATWVIQYADLEESRRLVTAHFREHGTLDGLSKRLLKRVPWFLFSSVAEESPLASHEGFVRAWLVWLDRQSNSSILQALLHTFLIYYPKPVSLWGTEIKDRLQKSMRSPLRALLDRCVQFRLLDPDGPSVFATHFYQGNVPLRDLCVSLGFTSDITNHGFVQAGLDHLLQYLRHATEIGLSLTQLRAILDNVCDQEGNLPRFTNHFPSQLADALLEPFEQQRAEPGLRGFLRDFLLTHFGDPRVQVAAWSKVSPTAKGVMLGWLSGSYAHREDARFKMFMQEIAKQLPTMEHDVRRLQQGSAKESIQRVRAVLHALHSIAGVAAFFGLTDLMEIGAKLEEQLLPLRDGMNTATNMDAILLGLDNIRDLIAAMPIDVEVSWRSS